MQRDNSSQEKQTSGATIIADVDGKLVRCRFDDSWSTLDLEAELLDRWFGSAIAEIFGDSF